MSELAQRVDAVRAAIDAAALAAGRSPEELTLIAVTKFHPASLVRELAAAGIRDVGENRHPEARDKKLEVADDRLRWHYIGQLQSNKARAVRGYADVIHSVDRLELVRLLASEESSIDCFVQLNLTDDPGRGGVAPAELEPLVEAVLAAPGLRLQGLMAVAPLEAEPRAAFARVRELSERVRRLEPAANALSMGMSHDFAEAIAEGATHLRIGTAITGNRPPAT